MIKNNDCGFILVSALLFLLVISLLTMQIIDSMLIQKKLMQSWQQQQQLFALAESGLYKGERDLQNFSSANINIQVKVLQQIPCDNIEITFYQITSISNNSSGNHVTLVSTYAKFPAGINSCQEIRAGRQSWRQKL